MIRKMVLPLVSLAVLVGSCILDEDVDDFDFKLPDKTFQVNAADLDLTTQTSIPCDPGNDSCDLVSSALECDLQESVCALGQTAVFPQIQCNQQDICQEFGSGMSCETAADACVAAVPFELSQTVNLAEEVRELQEVGNVTITKVTLKTLYIDVEVNTFGIDTPEMGLYVGAQAVDWVYDEHGNLNPNLTRVGTIPSFSPATQTVDVVLTTEGREALTQKLQTPSVPFKFFVHGVVELAPGDPLPDLWAGELRVIVSGEATASTAL